MKLQLKLADETLGYAETDDARTDPPMGCGDAAFRPSVAYLKVEALFRSRSLCAGMLGDQDLEELIVIDRTLPSMNLALALETGELLNVVGFTVLDCRPEFPEEALRLEFLGMHHEQFVRLFPGHRKSYEASCAPMA